MLSKFDSKVPNLESYSLLMFNAQPKLLNSLLRFQYFVHENYGVGHELDNDIMLIRIDPPVEYGEFQSPVCLPHAGYSAPDDLECYTTGWGALSCECII